ncbi:hypothetical protein [Methylobacterium trifolii]|uniref:Uncharacterized protein n=1 Tax=Methylobacterium trifolii TaxID=1003092 RepID=A0ABQ4U732_9HYPH|nr:hypothetical protein [Methylobacterium trifolii]GJE62682.1 hypothetical protein MPOCJGCO_4816 [Methylobacterium trifolii]
MKPFAAALVLLLATAFQAHARECSTIDDPFKRLQCFDEGSRQAPAAKSVKPAGARRRDFGAYRVDVYRGPSRQPDFQGRDRASAGYRTRIRQGMQGPPNFGGRLRVIEIGCGTRCVFHPVVDLPTGRVANFPINSDDHPDLDLDYRPDSRLVIAKWQTEKGCGTEAFVWNGLAFEGMGERDAEPGTTCGPDSDKRPYEGFWALDAKDCKEPSDGNFRIEGTAYKGWESQCTIDRATKEGEGWELAMSCGGEGETWKETTTYVPEADGRLFVLDKGRKVRSYLRCEGSAEAVLPTEVGMEAPPPGTLTEWTYDASRKLVWSCDNLDEGKGKACLAFACDYKSPTMTFFARTPPDAVAALLAPGSAVAMPPTGTQEEKTFAKLFGMQARTVVLDGSEQLGRYFDGLRRGPISVSTDADRWSFAIERGKSQKPVSDFRAECVP